MYGYMYGMTPSCWLLRLPNHGQFRQLSKGQPLGIVMDLEIMRMVSSSEFTNLVKGLSHEFVIGSKGYS
jgi:hypothetical protein